MKTNIVVKKKLIVLIILLLLAVVASWVGYLGEPEYGEGYSEEQRQIWNERRGLFPTILWCDNTVPGVDCFLTSSAWLLLTKEDCLNRLEREKALQRRQIALRDREKASCQLNPVGSPDLSALPAYLIARRECLLRARRGDGAACLAMARHVLSDDGPFIHWRAEKDIKYWLSQAETCGRIEARFLLNFFEMSLTHLRKSMNGSGSFDYAPCPDYTGLPGYHDFMKRIEAGDVLPYFILQGLMLSYAQKVNHELPVLRSVLKKRGQNGELEAMESLIFLEFEVNGGLGGASSRMYEEVRVSFWGRMMNHVERLTGYSCEPLFRWCGLLDIEDTKVMLMYREAAGYAHEAARRGSLDGMDIWLRHGLFSKDFFTREDWEELFQFHRLLLENSYVPYLNKRSPFNSGLTAVDQEILSCFYTQQSMEDTYNLATSRLVKDGERGPFGELPREGEPQAIARQLDDTIALYGGDNMLDRILEGADSWKPVPGVAEVYAQKVQAMATEGDPFALFVLAFMHEHAYLVERDLGKAWACYWEAVPLCNLDNTGFADFRDPFDSRFFTLCELSHAIKLNLLTLLILYPEFPGRDVSRSTDLMWMMEAELERSTDGYLNCVVGRVFEDGIGVPVDRARALVHYERGMKEHSGCAKGWERLQNSVHSEKE